MLAKLIGSLFQGFDVGEIAKPPNCLLVLDQRLAAQKPSTSMSTSPVLRGTP
jgi:hypothetical protein